MDKMKIDPEKLKETSPELYRVAFQKGTESPYSGQYVFNEDEGVYKCAVCGNPLFSSDAKFVTKSPGLMGWPSFDEPITPDAVKYQKDNSFGMGRTEITCGKCGAHLGHVFDDPSEGKTGKHYCLNCVSLDMEKKEKSA